MSEANIKNKSRTRRLIYFFILVNTLFAAYKAPEIIDFVTNYNTSVVLVAEDKIHRGQPLTSSIFRGERISKEQDSDEYYHDGELSPPENFVGASIVQPGEKISKKSVIPRDKNFINLILKPGYRALYLRVNPEQISKGLTGGWRVDISLTKPDQTNSNIILRNIKVLDVGRESDPIKDKAGDYSVPHYIVLEVSPEDAEALLAGQRAGTLNFLALSDKEIHKEGTTSAQAPVDKQQTVKIIRGIYAR